MSKYISAAILYLLLFLTQNAFAQSEVSIDDLVPDLTASQQNEIGRAFGVYTNATSVFTGLNSVSSGNFSFEGAAGEDDFDLEIYRVPVSYRFGTDEDSFRLMIRGVIGRFKGTSTFYDFSNELRENVADLPEEITSLPNSPDFIKESANSLSGGAGVEIELFEDLRITPAFDLIWTHVRRSFDYNNFLSALVGEKYDRELFNTSLEAISYVPSARLDYRSPLGCGLTFSPSIEYSHLFTEDLWSKSSLAKFSTDSGVLRSALEFDIAALWSFREVPIGLHPFLVRTDVSNAAHEALGFSYLHDVGFDFTFDTSKIDDFLFSEMRLGAAYIFADDFSGYRIGISADL